jgi:hypothetical protein
MTASKRQLENPVYDNRLWLAARNESLTRRAFIHDIALTVYDFKGEILDESGRKWNIPDIYEVMGEDGRWLSYYLQDCEGRPKHNPNSLTLERRRLIDLRYRIKYPDIAENFKR